jgi:predicted MPP superfamily phosphohydrolase
MTSIRIAHLSDLHACAANDAAVPVVHAAVEDLKRANEEKEIDLVAFTGDLARAGKAEEYELAHDLLIEPLRDALELDLSRLAVVPGNHDVDRDEVDKYQEQGLRTELRDGSSITALLKDEGALGSAVRRLVAWRDYYELLTDGVENEEATSLGYTRILSADSTKLGVASLDTAWRCSGDDDKGFVLMGEQQIEKALRNIADCDLRIVLMHHPYPWLASFDADSARDLLEGAKTLVLSGHDHIPDPTAEFSLRGGAIYSRAGCLYEHPKKLNGYTLIDVDLDAGRVGFGLRSWYPAPRRAFDQAVHLAKGGTMEFAWVDEGNLPVRADYSTVLESLGESAADLSVVGMLNVDLNARSPHEVLVEPRLWPAPYREIAAARDLEGSSEPTATDPLKTLEGTDVLLVSGEPESGVSGALLWMIARHFEEHGTHTPYTATYERKFKAKTFDGVLRRNASAAGQSVGKNDPVPPSIIALDDVVGDLAFGGLAAYIANHDKHKFVLGCHEDTTDEVIDALKKAEVSFQTLYLGPLGRAQVRALIEKIGGIAEAEVDRIFGLIVNQHLPRTPLIIAALIVAIQQNRDPSSYNESALLDACIRVLLSVEDQNTESRTSLDPRQREHLLAWFAGEMSKRKEGRLPVLKAEEELASYFRERGWGETMAPGDVLSNLERRRILSRNAEGLGFRHAALQSLFTAKRMNDDSDFADEILGDPFFHANAVRHAAGLRRDNKKLLAVVQDRAGEVLGKVEQDFGVELFDRIKDEKGWSEQDPDLDDLKAMMAERPVFPDQKEKDQHLERLYDDIEYDSEDDDSSELLAELDPATGLLSGVLRNSELVADVELKQDAFRAAIHGWSLLAIKMAVEEDQTDEVRERVESEEVAEILDSDVESLERAAELMITMVSALMIVGTLGSPRLEEVTLGALEDESFMEPTAHALFTTLFYVLMRFKDWDKWLLRLYKTHGSHPLVKHLTFSLAASIYRSAVPTNSQLRRIEEFLADRVTAPAGKSGGVVGGMVKSDALQELRSSRQKALMAKRLRASEEESLEG